MIKAATLLRSAIAVFALLAVVTNANKTIEGRNKGLRKLGGGTGKSSKGGQKRNKETGPDMVVFTPDLSSFILPRTPPPGEVIPVGLESLHTATPSTEEIPVGYRVLFQVGISSDASPTNQVGILEGVCTLIIALPAKFFCNWVFDFGNEDIVTTTIVVENRMVMQRPKMLASLQEVHARMVVSQACWCRSTHLLAPVQRPVWKTMVIQRRKNLTPLQEVHTSLVPTTVG